MSILFSNDTGWIISHPKYFENIKTSTFNSEENNTTFLHLRLNPDLFEISEPFKEHMRVNGKKVKNLDKVNLSDSAKIVKVESERLLSCPSAKRVFSCSKDILPEKVQRATNVWPRNNLVAVETSQKFFEEVKTSELGIMRGENPLPEETIISTINSKANAEKYLFPPRTKFYCNDVMSLEKVFMENEETDKYDFIVMDPPWWNKFIRKKKRKQGEAAYQMMETEELAKLPVKDLLVEGGVLAVWCTNAQSHQEKLVNEIFKAWRVEYKQTLYWLKVTSSGVPVCPFNEETKKQPFETIIVGIKTTSSSSVSYESSTSSPNDQDCRKIVISIPSSINSHKPPIVEVIKELYPDKIFDKKLEIFARYLIPGFTSYGNEVIKLQHKSLYVPQ